MNKRIKIILIITSILILLGINNVYAAGGTFSVNKTSATVEIGATTTFSITATNCGGKFTITSSNTSVATVSSGEEWIENDSKEIKITAKAAGTATITIKADDVASTDEEEVTGSKTIKITVPEKETNNSNNNNNSSTGNTTDNNSGTNTPPPVVTKSSEARLSNFGIKPNDFSGFKRDKYEYSTTVPNNVSEVEVYAEKVDPKAKLEGVGKVTLKEGNNTVKVTVTAEAGNTKTYTLTIKRKTAEEETAENGEARLKNLGIKPDEYDFKGFESEKTEYSVEVPNEVNEIEVYATAMNSSAQITGTGMIELKEGKNDLKVEVIAANGTKKTYTLEVTRKEKEVVSGTTEEVSETAEEEIETSTLPIVNENVTEQTIQKSWLKPSTWGQEEKIKIAIIAVLIILIICAIVLKINISKENKNDNQLGLPGAEELDKAMAEHQELSEEPTQTEVEDVSKNETKQNYIEDIAKKNFGGVEDEIDEKAKRKGRHF